MATLRRNGTDEIVYDHRPAADARGRSFVFFNPLTGAASAWEAAIAPRLRAAGHGTLAWNYRGQEGTRFAAAADLGADTIVADATALLDAVAPARPLYVGWSIGGLYAARLHLGGRPAEALVLVNTLRRIGPRIAWINEALPRAAALGGLALVRDLYAPLLFGEPWLRSNRAAFLTDAPYAGLGPEAGPMRLLADGARTDWTLAWERITVPVAVLTGLQDRVFLDRAIVVELAARLPEARPREVAEAGHMLPSEAPEAVIEACLELARDP